ncbi:MAG TPA: MFS transporter [Candidatus Methylacidiphilales bacterium]|jgi:Na+/melibiose symporter-like transporter|nr:MFS transporter [Candidatus Methylacidiphilales bacterium]
MITTCQRQVPFRWIAFAILPWAAFTFNGGIIGVVFLFSLKKFIENPAGLTLVLSLPSFVSLVSQPVCSFLSDRIWTRFGRRKPFVVTSFTGAVFFLVLMPLMPNFWMLLGAYMLYSACSDLNSPMEPLKLEIIPPQERGRATGAMNWCANLASVTFYFVALGRFDDVTYFAGFPLRGETAIYWSGALLLAVMLLLVALGIHEVDQKSALRGQRLSPRNFFGGLLDRELWPVYLLVFGASCLNFYSGLGPLSNLLYTDQWNYTKQEMGINVAVGGIINFFAIGLLTVFADRLNRMRAYRVLICLSLACQVFYYCYVNFVLPDKRPTLVEIIVFGETLSILSILTGLVYTPLVYDYIERNKMGTFNAGQGVVGRLTTLVTLNGVGLFVWIYAALFQPPSGEMTRVVVADTHMTQSAMLAKLRGAAWTYPADGKPAPASAIAATSWRGDGTISATGACWEIRLRDPGSRDLAGERDRLTAQDAPLLAGEKMLRDAISVARSHGADTREDEGKLARELKQSDAVDARIAQISAELDHRASLFRDEVTHVLDGAICREGDEILGATTRTALLLDVPVTRRPSPRELGAILATLRVQRADAIDLRPVKQAGGYALSVSSLLPADQPQTEFANELREETTAAISRVNAALLLSGHVDPAPPRCEPAVTLELAILEDPVPTYVSPITRVVNAVLGLFGHAPDPRRHLQALARGVRLPGQLEHVRIEPGAQPKTLAVTAVLPDTVPASTATSGDAARLARLLQGQNAPAGFAQRAQTLLERVDAAGAAQRITLAHPVLATGYASMKYDYMSGYLWMFVMGSLGVGITFFFQRLEARGLIRKRGVEEAQRP